MELWRLCILMLITPHISFAVTPIDLTFAVPAVATVVIIFLAIANMLAVSISNHQMEAWARSEIREFVAGIILIVIIVSAFVGSNSITVALTGKPDFIEASQAVVQGWLNTADYSFEQVIRAANKIRTAATYAPYLNIPIWYFSINYSTNTLGGVALMLGPLNTAAMGLTNIVYLSEGLILLLAFMKIVGPKVLLPLAFIGRLIPFTRKTGNTLIAVALAGMVFLPLSVIIADALNKTITMPNPQWLVDGDHDGINDLDADPWAMVMAEPLCELVPVRSLLFVTEQLFSAIVCLPLLLTPWTAGLYQSPCREPLMHQVVYPLIQLVFQIVNTLLLLIWEITYSAGMDDVYATKVFDQVFHFLKEVNNLALVIYLDFVLIGTMTIVMARGLSTAIGGEWYIAGIQRLI